MNGVIHHEYVDIPVEVGVVGEVLLPSQEELKGEDIFDNIMAVDGGKYATTKDVEYVGPLPQGAEGAHILHSEDKVM